MLGKGGGMRTTASTAATLAVAALALLTPGCATMQSTDWTGHDISEVIRRLGQPTDVHRAPAGTVYLFKEIRTTTESTPSISDPHDGFETRPYYRVWRFSVDANGKVTSYEVEKRGWSSPGPY